MAFDRHQRIAAIWNWLPAFRAAAEYESIQRAALVLGVSPSSLSRTIRLLEEGIGHRLFVRTPTGLSPTLLGLRLLKNTRIAMRLVDESLESSATQGRRDWGAVGPFLPLLLARAAGAAGLGTGIGVSLRTLSAADVEQSLLRGEVDLTLTHAAIRHAELDCEALPSLGLCVAAPLSALKSEARVTVQPPQEPRAVSSFTAQSLDAALELARAARAEIVVPTVLVPADFSVRGLDREPLAVFAVRRREVVSGQSPELLALVATIKAMLAGSPSAAHRTCV